MNYPIAPGVRNLFPNGYIHSGMIPRSYFLQDIPSTEEEVIKIYSTYTMDEILQSETVTDLVKKYTKIVFPNKNISVCSKEDFVDINLLLNTVKCLNEIKSILYGEYYMNILEKENQGFHVKVDWDNYIKKHLKDFDKILKTLYCKYYPCLLVCIEYIDGELTINY
jgi:hypothetical protein